MSRRILIEKEAREELTVAFEWYESQRPGLGHEFLASVDECLERLCASPDSSVPVPGVAEDLPVRRVFVKRFPYSVIFLEKESELSILAFAHLRRRPGYWVRKKS